MTRFRYTSLCYLWAGIACLVSSSCVYDKMPLTDADMQTAMRLRLTVANDVHTRAATEGMTPGTTLEQQVNTIDVFMGSKVSIPFEKEETEPTANPETNQFWKLTNETNAYLTNVWNQASTGVEQMAVMVNGRTHDNNKSVLGVVQTGLDNAASYDENIMIGTEGTVTDGYAAKVRNDINDLGSRLLMEQGNSPSGNQLMTSSITPVTLISGVSEQEAWNQKLNNVSLEVERVVAKGIVYRITNDDYTVSNAAGQLGTVTNASLKFAAVNGATLTYLFRNHAAAETFTSAIHSSTVANTAEEAKVQNLVRLGNIKDTNADDDLGAYKAQTIANLNGQDDAEKAKAAGIYFLENSAADYTDATTAYGYNRYATAKVYGQFTPVAIYELRDGTVVPGTYTQGTTFYYGQRMARFYNSLDAATADGNPRNRVYTYTNGWMAYRALWNRVETNSRVSNADVRRNHIYMLRIDGFEGLGMPWDPADPNDPNLPRPNDKSEPADGGPGMNPDVHNPTGNYMRITATIRPYDLSERDANLGLGY